MPPRPLLFALAVSLLLHVCALGASTFMALLQNPPPRLLQVKLKSVKPPPVDSPPAEPLVKNTLDREEPKPEPKPPEPEIKPAPNTPKPAPRPAKAEKREVQAAQRKIAEHTYYPPEAIAGGIEGDVRLLLVLSEDGAISDVQIAASSGHAMLDNAAIKAAYAMGRLSGVTARQMILPVSFRLR
jgi:protein TonB